MSTRYNKSPYTARTLLRSSPLKGTVIKEITCIVRREVHQLCSTKYGASVLRDTTSTSLTHFSWKPFLSELQSRAPTLYAVIKSATEKPRKGLNPSAICVAAALILKSRNKFLSQIQAVISVLLYAGHCSKQVSEYSKVLHLFLNNCYLYYRCFGD